MQRLECDGVCLECETSHLGSEQLAGLEAEDVAIFGIDQGIGVVDEVSYLTGDREQPEIAGPMDSDGQSVLGGLQRTRPGRQIRRSIG